MRLPPRARRPVAWAARVIAAVWLVVACVERPHRSAVSPSVRFLEGSGVADQPPHEDPTIRKDARMNSTELMAVVGAVTGTLGALTGIVALAWQIRGQRASGRVISVRSLFLIPIVGDLAKAQGRPDSPQVAVRVVNRGGQPVTVLNYGVSMGRSKTANLIVLSPMSQQPSSLRS